MAGLNTYTATLGPFDEAVPSIAFVFKCRCAPDCHCAPEDVCCDERPLYGFASNAWSKRSSERLLTMFSDGFIVVRPLEPRSVKFRPLSSTKNAGFLPSKKL
jgi:hypothetical protein